MRKNQLKQYLTKGNWLSSLASGLKKLKLVEIEKLFIFDSNKLVNQKVTIEILKDDTFFMSVVNGLVRGIFEANKCKHITDGIRYEFTKQKLVQWVINIIFDKLLIWIVEENNKDKNNNPQKESYSDIDSIDDLDDDDDMVEFE